MTPLRLALKGIARSPFRSWVVFLCALVIAGLALSTVLIARGAQASLALANQRLGADILVVPKGSIEKVEGALLMGHTTKVWMPASTLDRVAKVRGVVAASPQLYLTSLANADCCSVSDMLMVAYDPATDFTVRPWLEKTVGRELRSGEVVGGIYVFTPPGDDFIQIYGSRVTLKANLEPTGTNLDHTMFLTFETAKEVARLSTTQAERPLVIPPDSVSAVMVGVQPGLRVPDVASAILREVPGVSTITSPELFGSFRRQMAGLWQVMLAVLGLTLVLSLVLIGLVFSMAVHERRREIGVLRALGATRLIVFRSLLSEALLLALAGGLSGVVLGAVVVYLFRDLIMASVGFPFLFPGGLSLAGFVLGGLALVLVGAGIAAFIPVYRVTRQDPAAAMRE